jgi:hypothetical protein
MQFGQAWVEREPESPHSERPEERDRQHAGNPKNGVVGTRCCTSTPVLDGCDPRSGTQADGTKVQGAPVAPGIDDDNNCCHVFEFGKSTFPCFSDNATTSVADGATIEQRIRISQPDEWRGRYKGSRAWDPRKDFSQPQPPITRSTSNAI